MKFTKYILSLLVLVFAVSCTIDDELKSSKNNDGKIRLVTRVVPFNEYDVLTRASGEDDIKFIDYFIFAKVGTTGGPEDYLCVYYHHSNSQTIAIDRTTDFEDIIANGKSNILQNCQIVILANYPAIEQTIAEYANTLGYGTDVERFMDERILYKGTGDPTTYINAATFRYIAMDVPMSVGIPTSGLPRMGEYAQAVDLRPTADISGDVYPVNLQSLYAKMVFDINVRAIQTDVTTDETGNTFQFTGYTVHNLAKKLDMVGGTESAEGENAGTNDVTATYNDSIVGDLTGAVIEPTHTSFTCYLPERYLQAHTSAKNYQYPFKNSTIRKEDSVLLQRYKPLLVADTVNKPKATFVRFFGIYTNHQGHDYEVSYDIYVGNDNYSNFDVVRNRQYNNSITIKGIETSKDQSSVDKAVSIDHRVTIDRKSPIIVNFRRETLLDSHFEVRPLRIKCKNAGATGTVKVEVLTYDTTHVGSSSDFEVIATIGGASGTERPDWIRLERSYGDGKTVNTSLYCHEGELGKSSNGKRKYFTYNLVSGKNAAGGEDLTNTLKNSGVSVEVPLSELAFNPSTPDPAGCVWVYVDECLEASANPQSVRQALIRVTYNGDTTDYVVNQHRLYKVTYQGRNYYIEHEEEYLHNFDADDNYDYNQTEFQGMEWGLYNTQLSFRDDALAFDAGRYFTQLVNLIKDWLGMTPVYDFYVKRHDSSIQVSGDGITMHEYSGLYFTKNIVNDINGVTAANVTGYKGREGRPNNIKVLQLDQLPHSAIEYCYNRNKRNSEGTITTNNITWYMPAIDEMEDVMVAANGQFKEFQGQFYWSSQPAYMRNHAGMFILWTFYGDYYLDDRGLYDIGDDANQKNIWKSNGRARATKANFVGPAIDNYDYAKSGLEEGEYDNYLGNLTGMAYTNTANNKTLYDWNTYDPNDEDTWMDYEAGNKLRDDKCRVRALVDKTKVTEVND